MSITNKRSIYACSMFGFLYFFLTIYFFIVKPDHFLDTRIHYVINAAVIAITMISFGLMLFLTNKKTNVVDERDFLIQIKATRSGVLGTIMYVFLLTIGLFVVYQDVGQVNVSWMYYIAYSTFAFAYFFTSMISIYYYRREL